MKITLVHNAVIPPVNYGGTERLIYWLARGLHELGVGVTLIAAPGSRGPFGEVITPPAGEFAAWERHVPADTDLLHLWNTPATVPTKPFLVTIGGVGRPGERFHPNTVFVSERHALNHGHAYFVRNGIDPADYRIAPRKEDFAVFLAKASWRVKNLAGAIAVARRAGLRLEVLGSRDWPRGRPRWWPTIGGVKYRGMVGDVEKREILSRARALIFPVRWHEPFGLAVTEALASGCYVLGTPYGSLPEIVTPAVGRLSARAGDLAEALGRPGDYDPERCRAHVTRAGLTHLAMARAYVRYYENVLATGTLASPAELAAGGRPGEPEIRPGAQSGELLDWEN